MEEGPFRASPIARRTSPEQLLTLANTHTHTPHTHTHYTRIRRTLADWPSPSKDRFVVIASDGLWDEVTGEEAGKVLEEMGIEEGIQELGE